MLRTSKTRRLLAAILMAPAMVPTFSCANGMDASTAAFIVPLSYPAVAEFERNIKNKPIKWLHITSPGGDIEAAMHLGRIVHQRRLNVYVETVCGSSCANYVFSAGSVKVIGANAVVAWHGGANSRSFSGIVIEKLKKNAPELVLLAKLRKQEAAFFRMIKVSDRLVCAGDINVQQQQPDAIGWTMSVESMRRFGLNHVIAVQPKEIPHTLPGRHERILILNPKKICGIAQAESKDRIY